FEQKGEWFFPNLPGVLLQMLRLLENPAAMLSEQTPAEQPAQKLFQGTGIHKQSVGQYSPIEQQAEIDKRHGGCSDESGFGRNHFKPGARYEKAWNSKGVPELIEEDTVEDDRSGPSQPDPLQVHGVGRDGGSADCGRGDRRTEIPDERDSPGGRPTQLPF